jgi:hypothetical protein
MSGRTVPRYFETTYVRITPAAFDKLLEGIKDDHVFQNNSDTAEQLPVQHQLAITLYRCGHFGNGASIRLMALLFVIGYGTVPKCTSDQRWLPALRSGASFGRV